MADKIITVRASIVWTNERCIKAVNVLLNAMEELGDDFSYREDVQRAIRATRYLAKHVSVHADCDDALAKLMKDE